MEVEERIQALENEVKTLKSEIQKTLVDISESLPDKPAPSSRWEKKAWILALLNILLAVVLFTNVYLYLPGNVLAQVNPTLAAWLRAMWVAVAFMWLLLQMYPLALLLEQEDRQWKGVVWRNALAFLRDRPALLVVLTCLVLVVALVEAVIPAAWLILALALLVAVASLGLRSMIDLFREQVHAGSKN
jgi:hypothetical protein